MIHQTKGQGKEKRESHIDKFLNCYFTRNFIKKTRKTCFLVIFDIFTIVFNHAIEWMMNKFD